MHLYVSNFVQQWKVSVGSVEAKAAGSAAAGISNEIKKWPYKKKEK